MDCCDPRAPRAGRSAVVLSQPAACPWSPGSRRWPRTPDGAALPDRSGPGPRAPRGRGLRLFSDQREVQRSVQHCPGVRAVPAQVRRSAAPPSDTISRAWQPRPAQPAGLHGRIREGNARAIFTSQVAPLRESDRADFPGTGPSNSQPRSRGRLNNRPRSVARRRAPPSTHSAGSGQPKFSRGAPRARLRPAPAARGGARHAFLNQILAGGPQCGPHLWVVAPPNGPAQSLVRNGAGEEHRAA